MSEERTPEQTPTPGQEPTPQPVQEPVQEPAPQPQPTEPSPNPGSVAGAGAEPVRPATDWKDRRIGEQQARIRELRAQLEQFQRTTQPGNNPPQPMGPGQPYQGGQPSQQQIEMEIQNRAAAMAAQQEFNRRCNDTAEAGRRTFADFDTKVNKLVGLVDANDPSSVTNYNNFLNAAMETGEASKLIYALGGDLNEASRILSLSPLKMAVELTKMSARPVQEISQAPRPINPAGSTGINNRTVVSADDPNSDQLSTSEWMRRREEQVIARRTR